MSSPTLRGRFFLPGPTEVHPDVLEAQNAPMIGHRGQAIEELIARIEEGLKPVFLTDRPVIISTSSATGLMEAAVRNGVGSGTVLSLVNGSFSDRFAQIARACGREVETWEVGLGEVHDPAALADRLAAGSYEAVTVTHSETSTGALQDVRAIAEVVAQHEGTLLLVDSVTGIAGVETRTDEWGIDFILTGSQKSLALPPGLSFAVASEALLDRARTITDRGWYFDLVRLVDKVVGNQTPATPAVSLLYALDFQLGRILAEGMEERWKRHLQMQARTFDWVEDMRSAGIGVGVFARDGGRSPTVTCVTVPEGVDAAVVVAKMRSRGWVVGGGYGPLKHDTFRIGHMGDHTVEELEGLLGQLREVLR